MVPTMVSPRLLASAPAGYGNRYQGSEDNAKPTPVVHNLRVGSLWQISDGDRFPS
jgi:hypothetical protein